MNNKESILRKIKFRLIALKYIGIKNNIILSKDSNYNNICIELSKKFVKSSSQRNTEILKEMLKNFLIVLEKNCKNFDPEIFLKNFKKLYSI